MGDDRKFQPVVGRFEDTYRHYHGGGLVAVLLRFAEGLNILCSGLWFGKRVDHVANNFDPLAANLGQGMVDTQDYSKQLSSER
jgi:hypothetical protein